jgi:hypothetical protein
LVLALGLASVDRAHLEIETRSATANDRAIRPRLRLQASVLRRPSRQKSGDPLNRSKLVVRIVRDSGRLGAFGSGALAPERAVSGAAAPQALDTRNRKQRRPTRGERAFPVHHSASRLVLNLG